MKYLPEIESSLKKTHSFVEKHMANGSSMAWDTVWTPLPRHGMENKGKGDPFRSVTRCKRKLSAACAQPAPTAGSTPLRSDWWMALSVGGSRKGGGDWVLTTMIVVLGMCFKLAYKLIKLPFVFTHETHCLNDWMSIVPCSIIHLLEPNMRCLWIHCVKQKYCVKQKTVSRLQSQHHT